MKLDKSKYQIHKFGDIAFNISERVEPSDTDAQIYVGLEHLDSDNIHITRYGKPSDVKGTKLKVYKGDIIFGKRRAYQRKAAIADFDGICSAHAMVLRANPKIIQPDLLPFFMHSDVFMNKAIDISEGSLSPTIKWKTLAKQEFLLPTLDQQKDLAELLMSGEKLNSLNNKLKDQISNLYMTIIHNNSNIKELEPTTSLDSVVEILDNKRIPLNDRQRIPGPYPYYGANGQVDNIDKYIFDDELVLIAEDGGYFHEYASKPIAYKVSGRCWVNNHAHVLKPIKEKTTVNWIYYQLVHKNIIKNISGTTRFKLNKSELKRIQIYLPNIPTQERLLMKIMEVESALTSAINNIEFTKKIMNRIINEIVKS